MHLTDFQKTISKSIVNGQVNDIETFLHKFCDLEINQSRGVTFGTPYGSYDAKMEVFIPKDETSALNKTKEFITLWKALEKVDLLFSVSKSLKRTNVFPVFSKNSPIPPKPFDEILTIIKDYDFKEIVFIPEFKEFVERDFLTIDEFEREKEKIDRVESQKLTRRIAYITIIISVAIALLTALFNYLTYSKDRNVRIINENAFRDTIKVQLITAPDTMRVKDSSIVK